VRLHGPSEALPGFTDFYSFCFILIILHLLYLEYGSAYFPSPLDAGLGGAAPLLLPFFPFNKRKQNEW
jgi:hypothetical protein